MPRIHENIKIQKDLNTFELDANHLYLDTEYIEIYMMTYLTKKMLDTDILPLAIKEKFNPYTMSIYFGSRADLTCENTRVLYKSMVDYFINLFEMKMYDINHINTDTLDINNEYVCLIAECTNIIRGSIKKYTRNRTALNQIHCSKNLLEQRNYRRHKCPYPINDDTLCPSFKSLHKTYTCKEILYKAKHPNETFDILANISKYIPLPASNRRSRSLRSGPPVNTSIRIKNKSKNTRRIRNPSNGPNNINSNLENVTKTI